MQRSPAQVFALVFGVVLTVAGIIGFFYNASFAAGNETLHNRDAVFGILDVNGWHNVVHIVTGVVGLALVASYAGSRAYALGLGVVYILVAIAGIIYVASDVDSILKVVPVNTEDNILHALIGVCGVAAGLATPPRQAATTEPQQGPSPAPQGPSPA